MKVLFLQENGFSESIGICCLSAFLKQHGHDCDLNLLSHTDDIFKDIENYKPDLIGFTCFTGMEQSTYKMIRFIKKNVDVPVVLGGPHPTFYPECLDQVSELDFICRGEGEYPLVELLDKLKNGGDPTKIKGISGRWKGKTFHNPIAPMNPDINVLPMPDREIYYKYKFIKDLSFKRFLSSCGCPYNCTFCNQPKLRKEYEDVYKIKRSAFLRRKKVDNLIKEIKYIQERYPLTRVHFSDDLFSSNKIWLKEFAEKYPKEIGLPFSCNQRFDCFSESIAQLLKKANCYAVQLGLETGSERLRNEVMHKNVTNKQIYDSARILKKYGIKILTTNILGLPGETLDEALQTVEVNIKIGTDFIRTNSLMPFPGTEITDYAIQEGYLEKGYSLDNLNTSAPMHFHCKTPYENELKNILSLFYYMVKFPKLYNLLKRVIKVKHNAFIRSLGIVNSFQDVIYFKSNLLASFRFATNTLMKGKGERGFHWYPALSFKKKKQPT